MTVNYTINKTDGSIFVTVPQGSYVSQAGITLIGKNYVAFGEALNENIVHLAENFASTSPPAGAMIGQLWYDKTARALKVYSGSRFNSLIAGSFQNSAPTSPSENQLWFNTNSKQLHVYSGGSFRLIGPNGIADTQVIGDTIVDVSGVSHTVLRVLVNNKNFAIITDDTFTPANAQLGFSSSPIPQLSPGLNVGNDSVWDFKLRGLTTVSETLKDGTSTLNASNIIRNNANGVIAGTLNADNGLSVGSASQIQFYPELDNLRISNTVTNGNIYLQTSNASGLQSTVTITGGQQVGISTASPAATLHVSGVGTMRVDGAATFLSTVDGITASLSDNTTKFATTAYVKGQFNNTVLTGAPTATGTLLVSDDSARIATTAYVKAQFDNTVLTGVPTAPYIINLTQSDGQIANTKFVQDVIIGTLNTKAEQSDLLLLKARVDVIEPDYARLTGNTGGNAFSGTHDFTGATITVATPSAAAHAASKSYVDNNAVLQSNPVFSGSPTAAAHAYPTLATSDNTSKLATTSWVTQKITDAGTLGITGVDVQDESGSLGSFTGFNFLGSGVTASDAGGGVANVTITQGAVPYGVITMWYGTALNVPSGWSICDGTNGTPDLRDKFVLGAGNTYPENSSAGGTLTGNSGNHSHGAVTGGAILTINQIPGHGHDLWVDSSTDSDNLVWGFGAYPLSGVGAKTVTPAALPGSYITTNGAGAILVRQTGGGLGGIAQAHDHTIQNSGEHTHTQSLPPYHALYYIMKI